MGNYPAWEIELMFGEKIELLGKRARWKFCQVLTLLPDEVIHKISSKTVPISLGFQKKAVWLSTADIKKIVGGGGIIIFSEQVWGEDDKEIEEVVAHEIAHAYLKHRSPLVTQTDEKKAERGADKLASKWLKRGVCQGNY